MATHLIASLGTLAFLVILAAVVGTVHRRERYLFAGGVLVLLAGLSLLSGTAGAVVAGAGIVAVVAAAVPMLVE